MDPRGLEIGPAFHSIEAWSGWHQPGPVGEISPETKSYLCQLLKQTNGQFQRAWQLAIAQRKSDIPTSWENPVGKKRKIGCIPLGGLRGGIRSIGSIGKTRTRASLVINL